MLWLWIGPLIALGLGLAALLPYATLATAVRNTRRSTGLRSSRRTRRELHHASRFARQVVVVPLLVLVGMQGVFFVTHEVFMPESTHLAELFGENHPEVALHAPDLDAWNDAIEADRRDQAIEEWEVAQGYRPATVVPFGTQMQEALMHHWPAHLGFVIVPAVYLFWSFRRRYPAAAQAYHCGVIQRSNAYRLRMVTRS